MTEPEEATPAFGRARSGERNSSFHHSYIVCTAVSLLFMPIIAILVPILYSHWSSLLPYAHLSLQRAKLGTVLNNPASFPEPPYVLFSSRVVLPDRFIQPAYIFINNQGSIAIVQQSPSWSLVWKTIVDVSPHVVMPGLIDPHVHVNEPGRTSWEGFEYASRAAAAGGTTTILDMPLNNIPSTLNHKTLAQKINALASTKSYVDIGIIGGITMPHVPFLTELLDGGVLAFKSFMVDSQSKDFPNVSKKNLKEIIGALDRLSSEPGAVSKPIPYILHAELDLGPDEEDERNRRASDYNHRCYSDYEASRPSSWEVEAIRYAADIANNSNVHIHIAHVSAFEALELLREIRWGNRLKKAIVTAETCPHYLMWAKEKIALGGTLFKCSPPIRSDDNRKLIVHQAFQDDASSRAIDLIASDHSPCPPELKTTDGNLTEAWGGISGLQYRLQATWTAAHAMNASLSRVAELLCEVPARLFGIDNMKGFLKAGLDADIVIWDPESSQVLTEDKCHHRHKLSPYHGLKVRGIVLRTLLRGRSIYNSQGTSMHERVQFDARLGKLLFRSSKTGVSRSIAPDEWKSAITRK